MLGPNKNSELVVAPSILAGNHACLAESLSVIAGAGAPWVHVDIMDGHFVPNLTFGPKTVADLRGLAPALFFDVHLMLDNPHLRFEAFAEAGAQLITVHVEPSYPIEATLRAIRAHGCQVGLALNPGTPIESVTPFLPMIDLLLIMTVQPGFGGQSFNKACLEKIERAHAMRSTYGLSYRLQVDGGIHPDTAALCRERGADTFVSGSAFFTAPDKRRFVQDLCGYEGAAS